MLLEFAGSAAFSFVDGQDVAAVAVEALTGLAHSRRTYTLTGQAAITFEQVAAVLSTATRPVGYVSVGDDDARRAMIRDGCR